MTNNQKNSNKIWGGRFASSPDAVMQKINCSIDFDKRLYAHDIRASIAHAQMLDACGIVDSLDVEKIIAGLQDIEQEIVAGKFPYRYEYEDIHMNIEARLRELIGEAAGRLHTARSRNDQVATDFRLWLRDAIDAICDLMAQLGASLLAKAEAHVDTLMPGYTHMQVAQPVSFAHHLMAYHAMVGRDISRMKDCRARMNECPLGAAALAGSGFAIDRDMTAKSLGFDAPCDNSMDAVASRDFALEFLSAAAISAVHLSRLAEEMVMWSTNRFGFISFSDAWSTGSSIMPQKRNPDAAELVRGKTGRICAQIQSLLMVMKGLPLAYSKDMQEDKEPVFEAVDSLMLVLQAMDGMIGDMQVHKKAMLAALQQGFPTATDLADWLVTKHKMAFRDAHHITGRIVALAEQNSCSLQDLPLHQLQEIAPEIDDSVYEVLGVEKSMNMRKSYGGTASHTVKAAIEKSRVRQKDKT